MTRTNSVRLERVSVLKAMAHPSRLLMLESLTVGERCVCDLQRIVGADLSTVSKHLSLMRGAGLVTHRKQGLQVFYRLSVPCVMDFFDCVDAVRAGSDRQRGAEANNSSTSCCSPRVRRAPGRRAARRSA